MVPLDYVLAVAVLVAAERPGEAEALPEHACLARTVKEVALSWEVLDAREAPLFFRKASDFAADAALLRRRLAELADAPPACDAARFPGRQTACELLTFNRAYLRALKQRREALGGQHDELDEAIEEAEELYRIWDLVRDAGSDCYYVSARRQALLALRQLLGPANYYQGLLPPHVPVWRFTRRD